jgi:hypothetical protein
MITENLAPPAAETLRDHEGWATRATRADGIEPAGVR